MADNDQALYTLRYNQITMKLEGAGGTPEWNPLNLTNQDPDAGITQLTGDVTAGPGNGSQVATLSNTTVTPGSYTNASITVNAKGRITAASSGASISPVGGEGAVQISTAGAFGGDNTTLAYDTGTTTLLVDSDLKVSHIRALSDDDLRIDSDNWQLMRNAGSLSVDWSLGHLVNTSAITTVDWENTLLFDPAGAPVLDGTIRELYDTASGIQIKFPTPGAVSIPTSSLAIGASTPDASAIIDAVSIDKGIGFPAMTTAQRTAIATPRAGICVYDTDLAKLVVYTTQWEAITSVGPV